MSDAKGLSPFIAAPGASSLSSAWQGTADDRRCPPIPTHRGDHAMTEPQPVPNWDQGQGLSWSGKWHIFAYPGNERSYRALCGANVYRISRERDAQTIRRHRVLAAIAEGRKTAPVCKLCLRSSGQPVPTTADQETAMARVRALAEKWDAATNMTDGQPNMVARAFARELFAALAIHKGDNT